MSTTALVVQKPQLTPDVFQMISQLAPTMHTARLFGTASPEQAMAIMIKGFELGFSLTASFENVYVIEGKPSLSPKGALALIYNSGECASMKIVDDADGCTVTMKRRNGFEYSTRFTLEDAKRAGLVKPGSGWEKYPANMARWRAIGYCADVVFPDVIGGTKRADEFGADLTPDGDVIEGSWKVEGSQPVTPQVQAAPTVSQSQPAMNPNRLQELISTFGPDKVMKANNGRIPGTDAELDAIERELEITGEK